MKILVAENCGRQNNDLEDVCALISGTCEYVMLHGKKSFADVIQVIDIKIGR